MLRFLEVFQVFFLYVLPQNFNQAEVWTLTVFCRFAAVKFGQTALLSCYFDPFSVKSWWPQVASYLTGENFVVEFSSGDNKRLWDCMNSIINMNSEETDIVCGWLSHADELNGFFLRFETQDFSIFRFLEIEPYQV